MMDHLERLEDNENSADDNILTLAFAGSTDECEHTASNTCKSLS